MKDAMIIVIIITTLKHKTKSGQRNNFVYCLVISKA